MPFLLSQSHYAPFDMSLQDILIGNGKLAGPHSVKYDLPGRVDVGGTVTAKDIIIASGSVPFVPPGGTITAAGHVHTTGPHIHAVYMQILSAVIKAWSRGSPTRTATHVPPVWWLRGLTPDSWCRQASPSMARRCSRPTTR